MSRKTYGPLSIARRHPKMFSQLTAKGKLQFWQTHARTQIVSVLRDKQGFGVVMPMGELWL